MLNNKQSSSMNEVFGLSNNKSIELDEKNQRIYSSIPQELGPIAKLQLDDSIDIASRLSQLKKSIGMSKDVSFSEADKENINIAQGLDSRAMISKGIRVLQSQNESFQNYEAHALSNLSEPRFHNKLDPPSEIKSDNTEKQNYDSYFGGIEHAAPANSNSKSILDLFEEKNTRRNNFGLRRNEGGADLNADKEENCFPTPNKSFTEVRTLDYSGSHADKSFELYVNFKNSQVQRSLSENLQPQNLHSTQIETQRTEVIEEQYLQIVSRLNAKAGSVNSTSIQQQTEDFYREENEKLRRRLEDETNYSKQQIEALNLEIQRLRGVVDERKFEERTRESVSGYRTRIQELEKTVNDLALQLRTKAESEAELITQLEAVKMQFSKREEQLKSEIISLRREHETRTNLKESQMRLHSDTIRNEYVHQLENDLNMLRAKVEELTEGKSRLEQANANLNREIDSLRHKLSRNSELLMQRDPREVRGTLEDTIPTRHSKRGQSANGSPNMSEQRRTAPYNPRPSYSESLNKGEFESFHTGKFQRQLASPDENTRYLNEFYYKKFASLSEGLEYWKSRCGRLAGDFFQAFQQLREENEAYKASVLEVITKLKSDAESSIKIVKTAYKRELAKIVDTIEDLEEKHISNQVKLAETRTRCRQLELAGSLNADGLRNSKRRRSGSAKRKSVY